MIHHATSAFWDCYHRLPSAIQQLADKNYELLKLDPDHPSLHFKKVGEYRSVRVGLACRALGIEDDDTVAEAAFMNGRLGYVRSFFESAIRIALSPLTMRVALLA